MQNSERWVVGALLSFALLTFFFPLASLQLPLFGNVEVSGYDLLSKSSQFEDRVRNLKTMPSEGTQDDSTQASVPNAANLELPLSVRTLALLPVEILACFGLSGIALLLCISGARDAVKVSSTIAGVLGIGSVLHISMANSDIHSWIRAQLESSQADMENNPFAILAKNIGALVANSVHFQPGPGLYALAASVSIGSLLLHSKLIANHGTVANADQPEEVWHDDAGSRISIFAVIAVLAVGFCIFVFLHKLPTVPQTTSQIAAKPERTAEPTNPALPVPVAPPEEGSLGIAPEKLPTQPEVAEALTKLAAEQGQRHLYSNCNYNVLCVMDSSAPNDGFAERFTSNAGIAPKLYQAGFRNLIIGNGSQSWGWNITSEGFSASTSGSAQSSSQVETPQSTESPDVQPVPQPTQAGKIAIGQTETQVVGILGEPPSITAGANRIFNYPDFRLVFRDGLLVQIRRD